MRDLIDDLDRWRAARRRAIVARVVEVEGSSPRLPGAAMAVNEAGEVAGSVTGGCIESAVVAESLELLAAERVTPRVRTFGFSDDDAFAVGLTCGGTVHLFLAEVGAWWDRMRTALAAGAPFVVCTVVDGTHAGATVHVELGGTRHGTLGDADLDRVVVRDALGELAAGTTTVRHYGPQGQAGEDAVTVFVESFAPPPKMLLFGAVDFTGALTRVAKVLGYHVTVCDAREVFATRQRFPHADEVVVDWPHRLLAGVGRDLGLRDAVVVLTHDAKFDVPAIRAALATGAGYVGAMGSRRTTADRAQRLRDEGIDDAQLARVHAPVGLDIGARTPEEVAVAICAEIIATRAGRTAASLRDTAGPIH